MPRVSMAPAITPPRLCGTYSSQRRVCRGGSRKVLSEPGVYGPFAVFKVQDESWKLDQASRASAANAVKDVFQKHADKVTTDTYLPARLV